jgi:hypothetical protein
MQVKEVGSAGGATRSARETAGGNPSPGDGRRAGVETGSPLRTGSSCHALRVGISLSALYR